ncbi:sortase-associated OmpA-like protein PdsO [Paraglaciecola sp. L1A13]|uniref:sortase-associated OmpA-like protein PdsO n=1 Tax=Paraglaciecola sp. L1A13 TaxID=2686359 RepID=UPI00131B1D78|nr:sortase-associated OmpA-like protein PdsO [Paraglaciecola sp. L1A13]
MKYAAIALTLSLIINHAITPLALADTNAARTLKKQNTQNDALGFGSGALFGTAIAGPVGGVVGAIFGLFISNDVNNDKALVRAESALANKDQQLLALQSANNLMHQQNMTQLASLKAIRADGAGIVESNVSTTPIETSIQFRTGSYLVEPHYQRQLNLFAQVLRQSPELQATLTGYADKRGNSNFNQALSQQRAISVKKYLTKQNVNPTQLRTESFGETQGLDTKHDQEELFFARKVTVSISNTPSVSIMARATH